MPGGWFESVAVAQGRARRTLPRSVYKAIIAGSERGTTLHDNLAAFGELGFSPHVAEAPAQRDTTVTVMGQQLALPVLISPTGVQAVHPEGELAVARAAASRGVAMGLSSLASKSIEDVCGACDQVLFQMYWSGDRATMVQRLERAKTAGAKGIILTLD